MTERDIGGKDPSVLWRGGSTSLPYINPASQHPLTDIRTVLRFWPSEFSVICGPSFFKFAALLPERSQPHSADGRDRTLVLIQKAG
jgi:hypothetical protein